MVLGLLRNKGLSRWLRRVHILFFAIIPCLLGNPAESAPDPADCVSPRFTTTTSSPIGGNNHRYEFSNRCSHIIDLHHRDNSYGRCRAASLTHIRPGRTLKFMADSVPNGTKAKVTFCVEWRDNHLRPSRYQNNISGRCTNRPRCP